MCLKSTYHFRCLSAIKVMRHLAAEPRSTTWLLFISQCLSWTILLTPYSIVWDWRVSRAGPMLFYWPKPLYPFYSLLLFFPFSSSCLKVGIIGLGSSDWWVVYHSLPALHCKAFNNKNKNNNVRNLYLEKYKEILMLSATMITIFSDGFFIYGFSSVIVQKI